MSPVSAFPTRTLVLCLAYVAAWTGAALVVWRMADVLPWRQRLPTRAVAGRVAAYGAIAVVLVAVGEAVRRLTDSGDRRLWGDVWWWELLAHAGFVAVAASVAASVRASHDAHAARLAATRADASRIAAELATLRAQIAPRLVVETLATVRRLVADDPAAAERTIERLGDLLHYVLRLDRARAAARRSHAASTDGAPPGAPRAADATVPLEEEWDAGRAYLALAEVRHPGVRVVDEVEADALARHVPPFVLLPLLEHALHDASTTAADTCTLTVACWVDDADRLHLEVRDASVRDASVRDASVRDASVRDASVRDASVRDADDAVHGLAAVRGRLAALSPQAALVVSRPSAAERVRRVTLPPFEGGLRPELARRARALRAMAVARAAD